jgi:hypothetical protein
MGEEIPTVCISGSRSIGEEIPTICEADFQ